MFIKTKEVIEKYNVSNQTIKRRIKSGLLHPIKDGCNNLFDTDELDIVFKKNDKLEELKKLLNETYGYDPYIFLEDYKDVHTKIKVKCTRCNHELEINPNNMKNNIRLNREPQCKYCSAKKVAMDNKKRGIETAIKELESYKDEYEILEDITGYSEKVLVRCKRCNYEFKVSPSSLLYSVKNKKSHYCPSCNNMIRDKRSYADRLKEINPTIIPLEEYTSRKDNILHKCLVCGNEWRCSPNNRLKGEGCPKCSNKITQSKAELELIEFLKANNIKLDIKNRTLLGNGQEIDIYLPDYKLGIELNGTYYHSEKYKNKNYHLTKTNLAKGNNIRLIQIFDDEWNNKKELVKKKILYILHLSNNEKIYARKCIIKEINSSIKNKFLDKNHIQGHDSSNIKLGLFYNDQLVSVMTFCKPRRALGLKDSNYDYELSRFASDIDYIVIGAFSKLFSYFKNNYEWNNIITYADKRWSTGNVYLCNNWIHLHDSKPNYYYVNKNTKKRYHRYNFRKQALKTKFPEIYDDELTEFEIMDKTIYFRIWDCGNMVFKYTKEV